MIDKAGIYCIRFGLNERIYIGSAMKLNRRKSQHLHNLRKGNHSNPKLQNYYNKYGEELFSFNVLEIVDDCIEAVRNKEQEYLNKYYAQEYINSNYQDKRFDKLLLNVTPEVGMMRAHWTKERKQSLIQRNKNYVWSNEQRKAMSNLKKGLRKSTEEKLKQQAGIDRYWDKIRKDKDLKCPNCNSKHVIKVGTRLNKTKNVLMRRYSCKSCNKRYSKPVDTGPLSSDA